MKNSNIYQLIQSFSPIEHKEVGKFLRSPFFNTRTDLVFLYDYLASNKNPEKEEAWKMASAGNTQFDDQKCRLLMSYLHKLLEQYLSLKEGMSNQPNSQLHLAKAYRRRMQAAFEKTKNTLEKTINRLQIQDADTLLTKYGLQLEHYRTITDIDPTDASSLPIMTNTLDAFYLANRLRLLCLSIAQQGVYQTRKDPEADTEVVDFANRQKWLDVPAVAIYLYCYRMLSHPKELPPFHAFKNYLLHLKAPFGTEEMRGLYLMAINYCIRHINEGEEQFFTEALDLYKPGLEHGYLLENGVLSRFTYHNIVAAGLRSGELDWVEFFIHQYKNALERKYRDSSFSYNMARLEYERRHFDQVLQLLQRANYRDLLLNLAAKTLLLKTYYELTEYDLLQSHLDAMKNYIRRKRVIGYHKKNYINIVKYSEKLLKINLLDRGEIQKLINAIHQEEVLTEREWLLECLGP